MLDHGLRQFTNGCAFGLLLVALVENCKVSQCGVRLSWEWWQFQYPKIASAQPVSLAPPESLPQTPRMVVAAAQPQMQPNFGGGFIEFLFGDSAQQPQRGTQQFGAPPQERTYANSSPIDPMQE